MKAVILAAGYGTRLQRDVAADSSGRFAHLAGTAKPLLPVGRSALLSLWVRALTAARCVDCIHVVVSDVSRTNHLCLLHHLYGMVESYINS